LTKEKEAEPKEDEPKTDEEGWKITKALSAMQEDDGSVE